MTILVLIIVPARFGVRHAARYAASAGVPADALLDETGEALLDETGAYLLED